MRISLLEKRENFYKILIETLRSNSCFSNNSKTVPFYANKYLNFIATNKLPTSTFRILIKEYTNTSVKWRKILQRGYVNFVTQKYLRIFFSHKTIQLPSQYSKYLILGGNHRIRLFPSSLKFSLVLLKKNEDYHFIKNEIELKLKIKNNLIPDLLEYGLDWFKEEYFEGTPLNRLINEDEAAIIRNKVIESFWSNIVNPFSKKISIDLYQSQIKEEIIQIFKNTNINGNKILSGLNILFDNLTEKEIIVSYSHGDFQEANILVNGKSNIKVIDWESCSSNRFYYYDIFVLLSGIRSGLSIEKSINNFIQRAKTFSFLEINKNVIFLVLIEELRFSVNENYSKIFFSNGNKTHSLNQEIINYLNEKKYSAD